jgi:hypothetical protein
MNPTSSRIDEPDIVADLESARGKIRALVYDESVERVEAGASGGHRRAHRPRRDPAGSRCARTRGLAEEAAVTFKELGLRVLSRLWVLLIFPAGAIFAPSLARYGESFEAWWFEDFAGPRLEVDFRRQDEDGTIWLDVRNTGTADSIIHRVVFCLGRDWKIVPTGKRPPDMREDGLYGPPEMRLSSRVPSELERWGSSDRYHANCFPRVALRVLEGPRGIGRAGYRELRFEAPPGGVTFDSKGGGTAACFAMKGCSYAGFGRLVCHHVSPSRRSSMRSRCRAAARPLHASFRGRS